MDIPDATLTDGSSGQVERARLEDINGDGLADLVVERARANELWYWFNLGTDAFSAKHVITDMPVIRGEDAATRWADINGNGTTDLIYADSSEPDAMSRLRALGIGQLAGGSAHANLLTAIDSGLGIRTEITYKSSTAYYLAAGEQGKPWSETIPFPVSVISQVKTVTGLDLDTVPGNDTLIKRYSYRDGFYEDREKAFRGFEQVQVLEPGDATAASTLSTHRFFTGGPDGLDNDEDADIDEVSPEGYREEEALKGMVKSVVIAAFEDAAGDVVLSREENEWRVRNLALATGSVEMRFAYNQRTDSLIYEGTQTPQTVRTEFAYDNFGNVTAEKKHGALSITGDEAFAFTKYINDEALWIIGLPKRHYIEDSAEQKVSETLSYYDGPSYLGEALGTVTRGNLTRQEGWVKVGDYVDVVRHAYDSNGNIVGIRDGNGSLRSIAYDPVFHTFPVTETIEVGGGKPDLAISAEYNPGLGVIGRSTDFNGNHTFYGYDCFSRLTHIVRPGDSTALPTLAFEYTMADPLRGIVYRYDGDGNLTEQAGTRPSSIKTTAREVSGQVGTYDVVQYVDGLGRKLARVEEGESGYVVKEAVRFNTKGSPLHAFLPYAAVFSDYAVPPTDRPKTQMHYDAADREILRINPPERDDESPTTRVSTHYLPLEKTVTDENLVPKTFISDGLEQLIRVEEHNRGEIYTTRYTYDPLGNLTRIVDAHNNLKTMAYDGLNRKTAMDDPDKGHMAYYYDPAGNLVRTIDNKDQEIQYSYDAANRMLAEDYLDGAGLSPDVAYHYDTPGTDYPDAENTRGKLAWVKDLSGGKFFSYDARGNVVWTVNRIADGDEQRDFRTSNAYDAMDRTIATTYPDGDQVTYRYDRRGLLASIPGFVDAIIYHPSGQIRSFAYANGVVTGYGYDPRNRLRNLDTLSPAQVDPIQSLSYAFDGVSNITAIADHRSLPQESPRKGSQHFEYDDLYRLTKATGTGYGAINFQYDKIGNMTFKSSPALPDPNHVVDPLINLGVMISGGALGTHNRGPRAPGDPPGPHAITGTGNGFVYDYDDNGNMTNHQEGDVYEWNFKDRLVRATTADSVSTYVYDHAGQRTIKRGEQGDSSSTTWYVNDLFEIRDGIPVKYVFAGDRRVARIEGRHAGEGQVSYQFLRFTPGWNFFSLDAEPDDPAIAAVLAEIDGKFTQIWLYDAAAQVYRGYVPSESRLEFTVLNAQIGYLIHVTEPAILYVSGVRKTDDIGLEDGWNLIPAPSDAPIAVTEALADMAGKYESVWQYDSRSGGWRCFMPNRPGFLSNLAMLEPGGAYWMKTADDTELPFQVKPAKVNFFHPDHLGSTNVVTDSTGALVEETQFYPFGRPRYEEKVGLDSAYKYTGKELDRTTGLLYYEARYYEPDIGRFINVDPLQTEYYLKNGFLPLTEPYSYARNSPIGYLDPMGLKSEGFVQEVLLPFSEETALSTAGILSEKYPNWTMLKGVNSITSPIAAPVALYVAATTPEHEHWAIKAERNVNAFGTSVMFYATKAKLPWVVAWVSGGKDLARLALMTAGLLSSAAEDSESQMQAEQYLMRAWEAQYDYRLRDLQKQIDTTSDEQKQSELSHKLMSIKYQYWERRIEQEKYMKSVLESGSILDVELKYLPILGD